ADRGSLPKSCRSADVDFDNYPRLNVAIVFHASGAPSEFPRHNGLANPIRRRSVGCTQLGCDDISRRSQRAPRPEKRRHRMPPSGSEPTSDTVLKRYREAVARTDALIDPAPNHGKKLAEVRARAEVRLARLRSFLAHLRDPHDRYTIVHVGGTSGKGSTSTAIAAILTAAGYRTGLHTSPFLQVATEKLAIDGRLIAGDAFADLVDEILGAAADWNASP